MYQLSYLLLTLNCEYPSNTGKFSAQCSVNGLKVFDDTEAASQNRALFVFLNNVLAAITHA